MINWVDINKKISLSNLDTDKDLKALKNSIQNILNINQKELPGKPEFGSSLQAYLFKQITPELNMLFEQDIKLLFRKYEPRIRIETCKLVPNPDYNEVLIDINFWIVSDETQQTFNMKTSFYKFGEGTL